MEAGDRAAGNADPRTSWQPLSMSAAIVEFCERALLPPQWLGDRSPDDFRVYNPAIVRFAGRLLMAYRVDSGRRKTTQRRIALCQLDAALQVIPASVVALSDTIPGSDARHYDPRFLVYRGQLFIHYNNNFATIPNQISLVELDPDTLEARTPARPLHWDGPRQAIEKNWMLFEHEGELLAIYQIAPHVVLRADLAGSGSILCKTAYKTDWDVAAYAARFGAPRGGAPPVRQGDAYVAFFHSRRSISRLRWVDRHWPIPDGVNLPRYVAAVLGRLRRPFARARYYGGAYAFEAAPPFRPLWLGHEPVLSPEAEAPYRRRRRANPVADGIVYPSGALPWAGGQWLVSYGVHDERCCLRVVELGWPARQLG